LTEPSADGYGTKGALVPTDELPPPVLPEEPAHPRGGLVDWVTTVDHKKVGILYIVTSVGIFLVAGILARIVRLELAQSKAAGVAMDRSGACP
jgi:hypothetical protein